jgi:ornithine lipid hydroxylase
MNGFIYTAVSRLSWPVLFALTMGITFYGYMQDNLFLYFLYAYAFLACALALLEWRMPHEEEWRKPDGQNVASILHTISSKVPSAMLLKYGGLIGLFEVLKPLAEPLDYGIWPRDWPVWAQVVMAVYVAEFGLYWAHRLAHETPFLWRFHAIHHSVTKLWFVNTGRFHFMDSVFKIIPSLGLLILLGVPLEVIQWLSAITAFVGLMTHCNVDMKCGFLNYIFSTPELHRWHHSRDLAEGNRNYGENVILWDLLFGTYVNPKNKRPPVDIGMGDYMPEKFWQQFLWPLIPNGLKKKIVPSYEPKPFGYEDETTRPAIIGKSKPYSTNADAR